MDTTNQPSIAIQFLVGKSELSDCPDGYAYRYRRSPSRQLASNGTYIVVDRTRSVQASRWVIKKKTWLLIRGLDMMKRRVDCVANCCRPAKVWMIWRLAISSRCLCASVVVTVSGWLQFRVYVYWLDTQSIWSNWILTYVGIDELL